MLKYLSALLKGYLVIFPVIAYPVDIPPMPKTVKNKSGNIVENLKKARIVIPIPSIVRPLIIKSAPAGLFAARTIDKSRNTIPQKSNTSLIIAVLFQTLLVLKFLNRNTKTSEDRVIKHNEAIASFLLEMNLINCLFVR
jgi:hypothetical protein